MKTCFWTAEEGTVQRYPQSQIKDKHLCGLFSPWEYFGMVRVNSDNFYRRAAMFLWFKIICKCKWQPGKRRIRPARRARMLISEHSNKPVSHTLCCCLEMMPVWNGSNRLQSDFGLHPLTTRLTQTSAHRALPGHNEPRCGRISGPAMYGYFSLCYYWRE